MIYNVPHRLSLPFLLILPFNISPFVIRYVHGISQQVYLRKYKLFYISCHQSYFGAEPYRISFMEAFSHTFNVHECYFGCRPTVFCNIFKESLHRNFHFSPGLLQNTCPPSTYMKYILRNVSVTLLMK